MIILYNSLKIRPSIL